MTETEFQKFLTEPKTYQGKTYSNAQLIALTAFQQVVRGEVDMSRIPPLTPERENYYTRQILGEFIESNPKGDYRFPNEEKERLSYLESLLTGKYGLSGSQLDKYWDYLMAERAKLEKHYMDQVETFYHLSPVAPNQLKPCESTGKIGIDLKECLDAYHQMNGQFCYVAPKGVVPLCLRSVEMKMYPYLNPSFVVACTEGKDFEKSCLTCYEYEVERSSAIRPIIMPWGNEPVEYISTQPLKIKNLDNPKIQTPQTLTQDGLKIYLIDDPDFYNRQVKSPMVSALPIQEQEAHFESLLQKYPDKIRRYTPDTPSQKMKHIPADKLKNGYDM